MHSEPLGPLAGPPAMTTDSRSIVEFHEVSKWYGNVIGLNKLSLAIPAGVTGLLGPNGAGKSTLLQLATGQLYASQGRVRVLGQPVWNNSALNRQIGLCPGAGRLLRMDDRLGLRANPGPTGRDQSAGGTSRDRAGHRRRRHEAAPGPGDWRIFQGHAPADQAGPGPGPRSASSVSRRTADGDRSAGPARPDGRLSNGWERRAKA